MLSISVLLIGGLTVFVKSETCVDTDPLCTDVVNPCLNGGRCCIQADKAVCDCSDTGGYSGGFCQERPCVPGVEPCLNGGTCQELNNAFFCKCLPEYSGPKCEVAPCLSSPCQNGGACTALGGTYRCTCPKDAAGNLFFSGRSCELTPCSPSPCQNGATCAVAPYGINYVCTCPKDINGDPLYAGKNCENSNPCISNPCQNGAKCAFSTKYDWEYTCNPPNATYWGGQNADQPTICAASNPCANGGTCWRDHRHYPDPNSYACKCTSDWGCTDCLTPNPCAQGVSDPVRITVPGGDLCGETGVCTMHCSLANKYYCKCPANYRGDDCSVPISASAHCCNDPHCLTFDGKGLEYHGTCNSVLSKSCDDETWPTDTPTFQIIGDFRRCGGGSAGPTCVHGVALEINGQMVEIIGGRVYVDKVEQPLGYNLPDPSNPLGPPLLSIQVDSANPMGGVQISTSWGLYVTLSGSCTAIYLSTDLHEKIAGKICGLFGNADKISSNDVVGGNVDNFYASTILQPPTPTGCSISMYNLRKKRDVFDDPISLCVGENATELALTTCGIINNRTGPFGSCFANNTARTTLYNGCLHDMCVNESFKCANLEGYAMSCGKLACYGNWREVVGCPSICPSGMTYSLHYKRNCLKTCFNLDPCPPNPKINYDATCQEGCVCNEGTVWDDKSGLCIDPSECGTTEWGKPPYVGAECNLVASETDPSQLTCELMSKLEKEALEECEHACRCAIIKEMQLKFKPGQIPKFKKFNPGMVSKCRSLIRKATKKGANVNYDVIDLFGPRKDTLTQCYDSCMCAVKNNGSRKKPLNNGVFNRCFKNGGTYEKQAKKDQKKNNSDEKDSKDTKPKKEKKGKKDPKDKKEKKGKKG